MQCIWFIFKLNEIIATSWSFFLEFFLMPGVE